MITEKQKQIIKLLLTSKEGYNVNQIARILNISVSWAHETLKLLEREGILVSTKIANSILYKLNWENPKTEKICDFILLDTKEKTILKPEPGEHQTIKEIPVNTKPNYQSFYSQQLSQFKGYTLTPLASNIDSPYRQAIATQSFDQVSYSAVPIGEKGVNNVLFSYATSGAFGGSNVGYASASGYSSTPVPAGTLGSRVSANTSGFTMVQHTSSHKTTVSGCRYCGPEITL